MIYEQQNVAFNSFVKSAKSHIWVFCGSKEWERGEKNMCSNSRFFDL